MKESTRSLFLSALVLCSSFTGFAEDFEKDGIYYNINADETSVSVTFKGSSYSEFDDEYSGDVVIPSQVSHNGVSYPVTAIGVYAFKSCDGLTSIKIPDSVITISEDSFGYCTNLKSVDLGKSVTSIGKWAFGNCPALTSITIPESVTYIGNTALGDCTSLTDIHFNAENCQIADINERYGVYHWLHGSNNITTFTIGESVKAIPGILCYELSKIEEIHIPNSVTSIGGEAFCDCSNLKSINIPNTVTSIGWYTFYGCKSLTSITIPNSVITIGKSAFVGCGLTSIEIPNSITEISESVFAICTELESVTLPNTITSIGFLAFDGCTALKSINIPNSVTHIDTSFDRCSSLTSITIPESVTYMESGAFNNCTELKTVQFNAINCRANPYNDLPFFEGCDNLTNFTFGESVQRIPKGLFNKIYSLASVTIPASVTSIEQKAFMNCNGLSSIIVAPGNKVYDSRDNCNAIIETESNKLIAGCKGTKIPETVTSIDSYAFYNCSGLSSIDIPESVTSIGGYAFFLCSGLKSITIPKNVTSIGAYAFGKCYQLESIQFNAENCTGLSSRWLEDAYYSFYSKVSSFTFGETVKSIPEYICSSLYELTSITIPNSVTTIGRSAFSNCKGLTSAIIGNSVTNIGGSAFSNCSGLTYLQCDAVTPPSLESYGAEVFSGVDKAACTLKVPHKSLEAYKAADQWKDFLIISGLEEIAVDESNICIENGMIVNGNNEMIEVYNLSGTKVYDGNENQISLHSGIYIVRIGNKAIKVSL